MKVKKPKPVRLTRGTNPGRVGSEDMTELVYDDVRKKVVRVQRIRW